MVAANTVIGVGNLLISGFSFLGGLFGGNNAAEQSHYQMLVQTQEARKQSTTQAAARSTEGVSQAIQQGISAERETQQGLNQALSKFFGRG